MTNENPQRPQPDLNISAAEILKIPNVPAIDDGQQLLAELREMRAQWTRDITGIRQDLVGLRQDITGLRQDIAGFRQDLLTVTTVSYVELDVLPVEWD